MNDNQSLQVYDPNDTMIANSGDIDVYLASEFINIDDTIPAMYFPGADAPLAFYQTRDSLSDMERYKSFIDNCIRRFRKSRTYKSYKAYLMSLGMDRCQIVGNIQDGMADIEMHHNFLTIYDITILISQHLLNTIGQCTTFDVISLLMQEHKLNNIPIVMLSKTAHQVYHANPNLYIPISMTFGQWWNLLIKYRYGITLDIANKVIKYIRNCQENNELLDTNFFRISNEVKEWGVYNEYSNYNNYRGFIDNSIRTDSNGSSRMYEFNTLVENGNQDYRTENGNGIIYSEAQIFG